MTARLVGIRPSSWKSSPGPAQLSLDRRDDNWRAAEQILDPVTRKFGNKSVLPARLLDPGEPRLMGSNRLPGEQSRRTFLTQTRDVGTVFQNGT